MRTRPVAFREFTAKDAVGLMFRQKVLRRQLDTISRRRELLLTTDHIHQNSRGAGMIADVIDEQLLQARAYSEE